MESLLRWAVENSTPSSGPPPERKIQDLDPAVIDAILGKPDAVRMKEAMQVAVDEKQDKHARLVALDDLELLIESIDNANDLSTLNMWPDLFRLLQSKEDDLLSAALWVCGTAVQNNPKAQSDFLSHDPLPLLLSAIASSDRKPGTRSKAVYALSGSLQHNAEAIDKMGAVGGWKVLRDGLLDITVRRKIAFLMNSLLLRDGPSESSSGSAPGRPNDVAYPRAQVTFKDATTEGRTRQAMQSEGVVDTLIQSIGPSATPHGQDGEGGSDEDYTEKAVRCLSTYLQGSQATQAEAWTTPQKEELDVALRGLNADQTGLSSDEWKNLTDSLR